MDTDIPTSDESPRVTGWLQPGRIFNEPSRWITLVVAATVLAYHIAWLVSDEPYLSPGLAVLVAALAVVAVTALLTGGRAALITDRGAIYYFLTLAGFGAAALGTATLARHAGDPGYSRWSPLVGTLLLVGGAFVGASGLFLRPAAPGQPRRAPRDDFATSTLDLGEARGTVRRSRQAFGAGRIEKLLEACKAAVNTDHLHYVALFVDDQCAFYVDLFTDRRLETFFSEDRFVEERRQAYLRIAPALHDWKPGMDEVFERVDSGPLIRIVLDVERGALYYFRVDSRRYLVGVTVDQSVVPKADDAMTKLTKQIQVLLGSRANPDLN